MLQCMSGQPQVSTLLLYDQINHVGSLKTCLARGMLLVKNKTPQIRGNLGIEIAKKKILL